MLLSDLFVGVLALAIWFVACRVVLRKHAQDSIIEQRRENRAQRYTDR